MGSHYLTAAMRAALTLADEQGVLVYVRCGLWVPPGELVTDAGDGPAVPDGRGTTTGTVNALRRRGFLMGDGPEPARRTTRPVPSLPSGTRGGNGRRAFDGRRSFGTVPLMHPKPKTADPCDHFDAPADPDKPFSTCTTCGHHIRVHDG